MGVNFSDCSDPLTARRDALLARIESLWKGTALRQVWPSDGDVLTWAEALGIAQRQDLAEEFTRTMNAASAIRAMQSQPIIAVLGALNAGKSSVVASFLSETGRARIPRGFNDVNGTHRFVYWLPSQWKTEPHKWRAIQDLVKAAHGESPDHLSDEPREAAKQYRSGHDRPALIRRPLVAFDPALDQVGVAFLDCPDVQTEDGSSVETDSDDNMRLGCLRQAARICSRFLVVWPAESLRDRLLHRMLADVRRQLPTADIWLLINRVEPSEGEPEATFKDQGIAHALAEFEISQNDVFLAFDHRIHQRTVHGGESAMPGWDDLTPAVLVERMRADSEPFPQFFASSGGQRILADALRESHPAEMQTALYADTVDRLMADGIRAAGVIRSYCDERVKVTRRIQRGLLGICKDVFSDDEGAPTQLTPPEWIDAIQESIRRTAPGFLGYALDAKKTIDDRVAKPIADAIRSVGSFMSFFTNPLGRATESAEDLKDVIIATVKKRNSSRRLAQRMATAAWIPRTARRNRDGLIAAWNAANEAMKKNPLAPPRARQLDKASKAFWEARTPWEMATVYGSVVLSITGALAAVTALGLVAVDGGASALGTTSLSAAISSQLSGAGLVGAVLLICAGGEMPLVEANTLPNLSNYFALACDVFATPRYSGSKPLSVAYTVDGVKKKYELPTADIPRAPVVCRLDDLQRWKEDPSVALFINGLAEGVE